MLISHFFTPLKLSGLNTFLNEIHFIHDDEIVRKRPPDLCDKSIMRFSVTSIQKKKKNTCVSTCLLDLCAAA